MVYRGVGAECRLLKTEKIFSANNEQGTIKRGDEWFPENFEKKLTSKIFGLSLSRYVLLKAGLPLPSSCCKGEACLPRLHYKGKHRFQNGWFIEW